MNEKTTELTAKQHSGIEALLTTRTVKEAAKKAKVSSATMYRWLETAEFKKAYHDSKAEIVNHAMTRLQGATTKAVDTLIEISESKETSPQTRITACKAILNYSLKSVVDADIDVRLKALEAKRKRANSWTH